MKLQNIRNERFAQAIAKGTPPREAYEQAGYKPNPSGSNSTRMIADERIADRIKEILAQAAARVEITVESWITEGAELMRAALAAGDCTAASQQYERVAKVAGFWVDKTEGSQTWRAVSAEPMTPEEWQEQHAAPSGNLN